MRTKAHVEADESNTEYCVFGTLSGGVPPHKIFFVQAPFALAEGHIYSLAGEAEYRISKSCEYCFDKEFGDDEEDDEWDEPEGPM
jgi:hypothetical protein